MSDKVAITITISDLTAVVASLGARITHEREWADRIELNEPAVRTDEKARKIADLARGRANALVVVQEKFCKRHREYLKYGK